ncbi:hypothetical protein BDY19DRAFT_373076 [Irpex rosettiformis]|uniref:Uncharacterized protein n=1 Tax=Irpex rosettiformis TaxID=378272 RepID=A0ACB8TVJ0_9APHY|nr:hypothetical protein BDY19DRAFT_373076 [Irpex rosettiformis]
MAPPLPPSTASTNLHPTSFLAVTNAQDATDANLNKTLFLLALAFAIIVQTGVVGYLGFICFRRCTSSSSFDDDGDGDLRGGGGGGGGEKAVCVDGEEGEEPGKVEAMLPGLVSTSDVVPSSPGIPPAQGATKHQRHPSLRGFIDVFSTTATSNSPEVSYEKPSDSTGDPSKPTTGDVLWWKTWTWPPSQIDLERASSTHTITTTSTSRSSNISIVTSTTIPCIIIQDFSSSLDSTNPNPTHSVDSPHLPPPPPTNPQYLSAPPMTWYAPRHLVESPTLPSLSDNPRLNGGRSPRVGGGYDSVGSEGMGEEGMDGDRQESKGWLGLGVVRRLVRSILL